MSSTPLDFSKPPTLAPILQPGVDCFPNLECCTARLLDLLDVPEEELCSATVVNAFSRLADTGSSRISLTGSLTNSTSGLI